MTYVHDDVTCVHDDVTCVYDDDALVMIISSNTRIQDDQNNDARDICA